MTAKKQKLRKQRAEILILIGISTFLFQLSAFPAQWYAATNGLAGNTGAIGSPWDLQTALNKTATILPGDTLNLRGGNYTHAPQGVVEPDNPGYCFRATIAGTLANPTWIQSYPGELAMVDGGDWPHYAATARPALQLGVSGSTTIGAYLYLKNVRIYSSSTQTRHSNADSSFPVDVNRSDGLYVDGVGDKVINCIIDNNSAGISSFGTSAIGHEYYGNMIFNNGWDGTPNFHGHNFYAQGQNAASGLFKIVKRNISAMPYQKSGQFYGSSDSEISHYRWSENLWMGLQGQHGGFLVGTRNGGNIDRLQDDEFFNNFGWSADFSIFYQADPSAYASAKFYNNYFVDSKLQISSWKSLIFTNNTFINTSDIQFGSVSLTGAIIPAWNFNGNTYVFSSAGLSAWAHEGVAPYFFDLAGWRAHTGFELQSTASGTAPTTNYVIVQNNAYDTNRAQIWGYNWSLGNTMNADVSILGWGVGAAVTLHNCQDYWGDVKSGTVTAGNILPLDMRASSHTVAIPYGAPAAIANKSFPNFGGWIVTLDAAGPAQPPSPDIAFAVETFNPAGGTTITNTPLDSGGLGTAVAPFSRTNPPNASINLTAPAAAVGNLFSKWQRSGVDYSTARAITFLNTVLDTFTAIYTTPSFVLAVGSSNPAAGVTVAVSPADLTGGSIGNTPFTRAYNTNTVTALTAPMSLLTGQVFQKWQFNSVDYATTLAINVTNNADILLSAVYTNQPPAVTNGVTNLVGFGGRRRAARY